MKEDNDFLVDIVYLWCDGSDKDFISRKTLYQKKENININKESTGDVRFYDNEELKYSLRSLEMNASWIHHIFIVTDRQIPKWLNVDNPKISIVDHSEIMPKELIPCFNSSVIERYIANIPDLQEHFLYANDDYFFGEKVSKDFFFEKGKPIVRMNLYQYDEKMYTANELTDIYKRADFFSKSLVNVWKVLLDKNNLKMIRLWQLHHNIDSFIKDNYLTVFQKYKKELNANTYRFRSEHDLQRLLFSLDPVINKQSILKNITLKSKLYYLLPLLRFSVLDSYYAVARTIAFMILRYIRPILFCINNSGKNDIEDKKERDFLEWKYPHKSGFEK